MRTRRSLSPNPYTLAPAVLAGLLFLAAPPPVRAQDPSLYSQLRWRSIGPMRASRTVAAVGVPGRPYL